jgi:hypothetical protein
LIASGYQYLPKQAPQPRRGSCPGGQTANQPLMSGLSFSFLLVEANLFQIDGEHKIYPFLS